MSLRNIFCIRLQYRCYSLSVFRRRMRGELFCRVGGGLPFNIAVRKIIFFADSDNIKAFLNEESRELPQFLKP